jgi:catechol 2,3-dioxygenase-like lactoylglutathione lyase family enzyme
MRKLSEIALFTEKVQEVTTFYERMLDAPPAFQSDDMAMFKLPGDITLLIHKKYPPQEGQPPNEDHIAFAADDVSAIAAELAQHGLTLLLGVQKYDWGTSAYLQDPDGRVVEVQGSE